MMRRRGGFTLVELMISVALMVILLGAVTLIFIQTTDTVAISEARMSVYTNTRYGLDMMANDLMSCVSFNSGQQEFTMENGRTGAPGSSPVYGVTGGHIGTAADRISYICTTTVGDTLQTCKVTYELMPGNMALDDMGNPVAGDESHRETAITRRGLFTLIRRVRVPDPNAPPPPPGQLPRYDRMPKDRAGNTIRDTELCHYVLSFNLEYFANNQNFSQLEPSPFQPEGRDPAADPLGNGKGNNDVNPVPGPGPGGPGGGGPVQTTALRIPYIRATIVIVEDTAERQERSIQKAMWIPVG